MTTSTTPNDVLPFENKFDSIQYWNTQAADFVYPEMAPGSQNYAPIQNRANAGICVSGGGSVSASLIAGYYAALSQLNIMSNLRYISGVSGGTWGSAPYVYSGISSFSGAPALPAAIILDDLTNTAPDSMQSAVATADIADTCTKLLVEAKTFHTPENRVYEIGVGKCFLNPFNINSPNMNVTINPPASAEFFSSTTGMVTDIQGRNTKVGNKFMTMANNMPFLIMNATMFVPVKQEGMDPTNYICPFEITPLYSGIKAPQTIPGCTQSIGGVFVESFGFNTTLTGVQDGVAQATGTYPFELCQPVGASGAALESMLESAAPQLLGCFPQFNYWNPLQPGGLQTEPYDFGDGGCIEDTGITSLLARGVENIGVFLTEPVFFPGTDTVGCSGFTERVFGYNQIAVLFGAELIDADASAANNQLEYISPTSTTKQVFESSAFQPLLTSLLNARTAGNGMVVSVPNMTVVANSLFGISQVAGYTPNVVWSVIDKASNWATPALSAWMKSQPDDTLIDFPEVAVFFQNPSNIIELTAPQTNLLADFGYWMVMNNQDTFTGVLTPTATPVAAEAV